MRRASRRCASGLMRGQAMTELLVMMIVLGVMVVGIWLIGRLFQIDHATHLSARYVAWRAAHLDPADASAFSAGTSLLQSLRRRFFEAPALPLTSSNGPLDDARIAASGGVSRLVSDRNTVPLIDRQRPIALGFGTASEGALAPSSPAGLVALPASADPIRAAGDKVEKIRGELQVLPADVNDRQTVLPRLQVFGANVSVPLAQPDLLDTRRKNAFGLEGVDTGIDIANQDWTMRRQAALLPNTWAARSVDGTSHAIARREASGQGTLIPSQVFAPDTERGAALRGLVGGVAGLEETVKALPDPRIGELGLWRDQVPADRLR